MVSTHNRKHLFLLPVFWWLVSQFFFLIIHCHASDFLFCFLQAFKEKMRDDLKVMPLIYLHENYRIYKDTVICSTFISHSPHNKNNAGLKWFPVLKRIAHCLTRLVSINVQQTSINVMQLFYMDFMTHLYPTYHLVIHYFSRLHLSCYQ